MTRKTIFAGGVLRKMRVFVNTSMPKWQKQELDKRYTAYKEGKQNLHEWQSVHDELRNAYK